MNFKIIQETHPTSGHQDNIPAISLAPKAAMLRRMHLTSREKETLEYMAAGFTADKIAQDLFISRETVVSHRKNIIRKLGVPNVTAAVAFALRNRLIS